MRFVRDDNIRLTALEGEGIVLHLHERKYFSVNETGLLLLEELREPRTMAELVEALEGTYEVSREQATTTTNEFLERCLAVKVVLPVAV